MKKVDHRGPLSLDIRGAWYFITICAEGHEPWKMTNPNGRAGAPRTPDVSDGTVGTCKMKCKWSGITRNNEIFHFPIRWYSRACSNMMSAIESNVGGFGVRGAPALPRLIANWKHWLVTNYGILFQENFWDTRLRDDAHYGEKFRYVCNNPVRKGLCAAARDWEHVIAFDCETGEEREHR